MDEYTRPCLVIHPARSIPSAQGLDTLQALVANLGVRRRLFARIMARNLSPGSCRTWCAITKVQTLYIEPGSPWQNGLIERFHSRFSSRMSYARNLSFPSPKPASSWRTIGALYKPATTP